MGAGLKAGIVAGLLSIIVIPVAILMGYFSFLFTVALYMLLLTGAGILAGRFLRPTGPIPSTGTYIGSGLVAGVTTGIIWAILWTVMFYGFFSLMPQDALRDANQAVAENLTAEQRDQLRELDIDPQNLYSGEGLSLMLTALGAVCGLSSFTLGAGLGALGGLFAASRAAKRTVLAAAGYPAQGSPFGQPGNYQSQQAYPAPPPLSPANQPQPGQSIPPYQYTPPQQPNPYTQPVPYGKPGLYSQQPPMPSGQGEERPAADSDRQNTPESQA